MFQTFFEKSKSYFLFIGNTISFEACKKINFKVNAETNLGGGEFALGHVVIGLLHRVVLGDGGGAPALANGRPKLAGGTQFRFILFHAEFKIWGNDESKSLTGKN